MISNADELYIQTDHIQSDEHQQDSVDIVIMLAWRDYLFAQCIVVLSHTEHPAWL